VARNSRSGRDSLDKANLHHQQAPKYIARYAPFRQEDWPSFVLKPSWLDREHPLIPHTQEVDYAGTRRNIISRNPPFVDDDGFEVYSEDEMDERFQDALANAIDTNPYANVHIERLSHLLPPSSLKASPS